MKTAFDPDLASISARDVYEHWRTGAFPELPPLKPGVHYSVTTLAWWAARALHPDLAAAYHRVRDALTAQTRMKEEQMNANNSQQQVDPRKERRLRLGLQAAARQVLHDLKRIGQTLTPDQHADLMDTLSQALAQTEER